MIVCKECNREFRHNKSLGLHIVQTHKITTEKYYKQYLLIEGEDKCKNCGKDLRFYGLVDRFKGGMCYECSQSNKASQCNKNGKITEEMHRRWSSWTEDSDDRLFHLVNKHVKTDVHKEHLKEQRNIRWSNPENREKTAEQMRELWNDPYYRSRYKCWGNSGSHESPKVGIVFYRSSWELNAYKVLDDNPLVKTYTNEPFRILYTCEGRGRYYYPDILVEYTDGSKELVEIKPEYMLRDTNVQIKILAGIKWSLENSIPFTLWTEETWPKSSMSPSGEVL